MSISNLGALVISDPATARARILSAIKDARGDRKEAAGALGTTHRSLYRYIERLKLWDAIDAMIEEHGFPVIPGPPRTFEKYRDALVAARGSFARAAATLEMDPDILRARLTELDAWNAIDRDLARAGHAPLKRPSREAAAPAAR